jgi:hypothetical protein
MLMKCSLILICATMLSASCHQADQHEIAISKEEMINIVKINDAKFSEGIRTKNVAMLTEIYSDSAQYVQPAAPL